MTVTCSIDSESRRLRASSSDDGWVRGTRPRPVIGSLARLERTQPTCSTLTLVFGIGTAINVVAVLVGGGIGTLMGAKLLEAMRGPLHRP